MNQVFDVKHRRCQFRVRMRMTLAATEFLQLGRCEPIFESARAWALGVAVTPRLKDALDANEIIVSPVENVTKKRQIMISFTFTTKCQYRRFVASFVGVIRPGNSFALPVA